MQQNRTRTKIISDVLEETWSSGGEGGASVSELMRTCHLSYSNAVNILGELVGAGLLREVREDRSTRYQLSEKGSLFLERFERLQDFVESYGLRL